MKNWLSVDSALRRGNPRVQSAPLSISRFQLSLRDLHSQSTDGHAQFRACRFLRSPGGKEGVIHGHSQLWLVLVRPRDNLPPITGAGEARFQSARLAHLMRKGEQNRLHLGRTLTWPKLHETRTKDYRKKWKRMLGKQMRGCCMQCQSTNESWLIGHKSKLSTCSHHWKTRNCVVIKRSDFFLICSFVLRRNQEEKAPVVTTGILTNRVKNHSRQERGRSWTARREEDMSL